MAEQEVLLQWHRHSSTLLQRLPELLDTELFTDITLSVECRQIRAHRLVLASCSAYFLELFQEMGPLQHPVVVLHNLKYEDVRAIISFMYKGHCQVQKDRLPDLLAAGKLLQIRGLNDMQLPTTNGTVTEDYEDLTLPVMTDDKLQKTLVPDMFTLPPMYRRKNPRKQHSNSTTYWDNTQQTDIPTASNPQPTSTHTPSKEPKPPKDSSETCKCFLCGKYLSNQYNLRVHMETHEEAYHACQSCPHVSRSRDALRKHISYRHPEECVNRKRKKHEDGCQL